MVDASIGHSSGPDDPGSGVWAPCRANCPVHIDVPGYLSAVAEGRFTDALGIVLERNPLPAVCGRVCLRPCEEECRRCQVDDPIAIAAIKRAAADYGIYPAIRPVRPRPESIAVVGSGPAGLTAAHDLAAEGYRITIYEAKPLLGGMLRYGIPEYRLPDKALDRDIDHILSLGITALTGVRVGDDVTVDDLLAEHDAVLVTVGLQDSRSIPIPGADLPQVMTALPFLDESSRTRHVDVGKQVAVVGGGNVAVDSARTALRLGADEVFLVYRRTEEEMPARAEEIHHAEEEGVEFKMLCLPVEILGHDGRVTGITATRMELGEPDESGRPAPICMMGSEFTIECDTVIMAIGQGADVEGLGLPLTARRALEVHPLTLRTPVDRVYAAGDVVSGPTKIIDAIAAGHRAAAAIRADLTGDMRPLADLDVENDVLGTVPEDVVAKLEIRRRGQMERLESYERTSTFDEVESGYTEYEAAHEAQRCLSCTTGARFDRDKCAACLTCTRICPHDAPVIERDGYPRFSAEACHACGACAAECPAQAIRLEGYSEREMSLQLHRELAHPRADQVLVFSCGYTPDLLDSIDHDAKIITLPCLLHVSERAVMEAFEIGAGRIVFSGCVEETCRFPHAIPLVENRAARIRALAEQVGMADCFHVADGV